jgi:small-conductance mechanosensitive channel/CRP-like cAMP-binding protein
MNAISSAINYFLAHPAIQIVAVAALLIYRLASKRYKNIPFVPVGFLFLFLLLQATKSSIDQFISAGQARVLDTLTTSFLYFAAVRICFAIFVERWFLWKKGMPIPKITKDFALFIIYAIIFLVLMRTRGNVNLAGIITTSAVITASIGFAAQSTLSNVLAGLTIQLDRPFTVGDWIRVGDNTGQVTGIGWKSTHIRTFENEDVVIPNSEISSSTLKNFSASADYHMMSIPIGIDYSASPNKVMEILINSCLDNPLILKSPEPFVRLASFDDSSIHYNLYFAYKTFAAGPRLKSDISEKVWYSLRRNGIRIPFPIHTVQFDHIERKAEEGRAVRLREEASSSIASHPVLGVLSKEDIESVVTQSTRKCYGKGETIVRQGDSGDSAYLVTDGECEVLHIGPGGRELPVARLKPPAIFGEISLITGDKRAATVRAMIDTHVLKIDKEAFSYAVAADPSISEKLADIINRRASELSAVREEGAKTAETKLQLADRIKKFFGIC